MQGGNVRVGGMPDPIVAPELFATPGADEALTMADSLWRWLIDSGVKIVVILIAATVIMIALNWLLRRFFRTMVESSSRLSNVTGDRKSTRLNSSHVASSYAVFCLKKIK